ncbi:hypothetical protein [Microseira sp. BLCC-F43]|uniref:hypothetical protein n=1 Tax=Microseira sp. BLCC-F43 TaxID=3153602 RepID=UPI0035B8531F
MNLNRNFQRMIRTVAIALLVGTIWLLGFPAFSATAGSYVSKDTTVNPTAKDSSIAKAAKQRIESVDDCSKYLTNGNKDTTAHLDKPLDRSGSTTLPSTLKVSDNPAPTVAEVEFKRCLEAKGIAPKP